MSHTTIKDAWFAPDAMVTSGLLGRYRDNIRAVHSETRGFAFKPSDETVNASTVLQDDDDLSFEVEENETWHVRLVLEFSMSAAGDIKLAFSVPSAPVGEVGYMIGMARSGNNPGSGASRVFDGELSGTEILSGLQVQNGVMVVDAFILVGATGGTVTLQWAQAAAAGNTTLHENSYLSAQRMDAIDGAASYTEIAATDVDGKSPLKTELGQQLRDNPVALYQERSFARKASDQSVAGSTTLQDDDDLAFAVGADEEWYFEIRLIATTLAAADLKLQITGPAGATGSWGGFYPVVGAAPEVFITNVPLSSVGAPASLDSTDDVVAEAVVISGYVVTAGTAGIIQLEWAQDTSNGTATTIHEHSFLVAHRMDVVDPAGATFTVIPDSHIDPESEIDDGTNVIEELADNAVAGFNAVRSLTVKDGDETVTNDTTLQDDDDLAFGIGADSTWVVTLLLDLVTPNPGGFKFQITTPDGGDVGYILGFRGMQNSGNVGQFLGDLNTEVSFTTGGVGRTPLTWIEAWITTGSTAGTVQLEWAQRTGVMGDTTVGAGSFMYARRLDDF